MAVDESDYLAYEDFFAGRKPKPIRRSFIKTSAKFATRDLWNHYVKKGKVTSMGEKLFLLYMSDENVNWRISKTETRIKKGYL